MYLIAAQIWQFVNKAINLVVLSTFAIASENKNGVFHLQPSKWLRTPKRNKPIPWNLVTFPEDVSAKFWIQTFPCSHGNQFVKSRSPVKPDSQLSYDFPILGFLRRLRFLGQPGSHSSEESPTARGIYLWWWRKYDWRVLSSEICSVNLESEICSVNLVSEICSVNSVSEICSVNLVSEICSVNLVSETCSVNLVSEICSVNLVSEICSVNLVSEICSVNLVSEICCCFWELQG